MSGADLTRLLTHVSRNHFGPIPSIIVQTLLDRGALAFPQLLLLSQLPPKLVHQSLLILSLHSSLFHSQSDDSGSSTLKELYEVNEANLYERMRGARWVESIREENEVLSEIVAFLWKEGMVNVESILVGLRRMDRKKETTTIIRRALRDGWINIVTPGSQVSPRSLEVKWEGELRMQLKGVPTGKDLKDLKAALKDKKVEWKEEEKRRAHGRPASTSTDDSTKKKHRRRVEGDVDLPILPKNAFFRVNAERFNIRWRNQLILEHADQRWKNEGINKVLSTILKMVEPDVDSLTEKESRQFTTHEILPHLGSYSATLPSLFASLSSSIPVSAPNDPSSALSAILHILARSDDSSFDTSKCFLVSIGGSSGRWAVNYKRLGEGIRRDLIERFVRELGGEKGLLVWRVLEKKGMLEEAHLARLAFLPIKEARETLSTLSSLSLIETQEVPRSADRAPSRTLYLFHISLPKLTSALLLHLYKAQANVYAQKEYQLELKKGLVDKFERGGDEGLSMTDRVMREKLVERLEALEVANMRIDRDVFLLKGWDE